MANIPTPTPDDAALPGASPASRATSYDVARLAGVSQSAVSRAFRAGGSISSGTRYKVEKAAQALSYAPNQIARSLITQRSRMVGVVMTETTAHNTTDVLRHLSDAIQTSGNRMLLCTVPEDAAAAVGITDLLAFHVDGIVSSARLPPETLEAARRQRVPLVMFNRAPPGLLAASVACDHAAGMALMIDHLATGNLGRAEFVAGPRDAPVSNDRLAGAAAALAAKGLALSRIVHGDYSYESGRDALHELVAGGQRPDTVICANDAMALGVMDALRFDLGLRVPDDVAVAGFDDVPQSAWPTYSLTTLRQPVRRMAEMSVRLLLEQVAGAAGGGERRLMPAELKLRGSTRRPTDVFQDDSMTRRQPA
jgi:DNA-binding LacI/PurR family transcriptional regulator